MVEGLWNLDSSLIVFLKLDFCHEVKTDFFNSLVYGFIYLEFVIIKLDIIKMHCVD